MRIKFRDWDCNLIKRQYGNGRVALCLVDANDGSPIATATTNMPDMALGEKQVFIKDYSENAGMLATLEKAGVVKSTGKFIRSGFVQIPICDLLI